MPRITLVLAIAAVVGGCGSSSSGSPGGSSEIESATTSHGGTAQAPAINGGAASGPAVGGGAASVPVAGAGGSASGPSAGKGGAATLPAVGSNVGGGAGMLSCSQVAAYARSLGTPAKCAACLESSCCAALIGCYNSSDCLTYAQCVSSCNDNGGSSSGSSSNCGCDSRYPDGVSAFDQYDQCVFSSCESECVTVIVTMGNPPGGGASGSSGGTSCLEPGSSCTQDSDCCSMLCNNATSSGATINYCE
jgi:hypothetical protein